MVTSRIVSRGQVLVAHAQRPAQKGENDMIRCTHVAGAYGKNCLQVTLSKVLRIFRIVIDTYIIIVFNTRIFTQSTGLFRFIIIIEQSLVLKLSVWVVFVQNSLCLLIRMIIILVDSHDWPCVVMTDRYCHLSIGKKNSKFQINIMKYSHFQSLKSTSFNDDVSF